MFSNLMEIIRKHGKNIPAQILTEAEQISAGVERGMGCQDYESAFSTLKKLLEENLAELPKKTQEEIKEILKGFSSERPKELVPPEPDFGPGSS